VKAPPRQASSAAASAISSSCRDRPDEQAVRRDDQHIVHVVDWLWQYAFDQRASDIHMEPRRDSGEVRFRIDGVLHPVYQIPMPVMAGMTSRIKILAAWTWWRKRRPQDGRFKTRTADGQTWSCACRRCRPRSGKAS